jgi:hypothetical protein
MRTDRAESWGSFIAADELEAKQLFKKSAAKFAKS